MNNKYGKIVDFVHLLISTSYGGKNDLNFIDATCGNGFDTLFLCMTAGKSGHVLSFDIQNMAIQRTKTLLEENLEFINYTIINDSHENAAIYIDRPVDAVIFNLGYLPFSDKSITTNSETTCKAIKNMLPFLNEYGRLYITTYITHNEGDETKEIISFLKNLNKTDYNVIHIKILNKENSPPELLIIEKNI